MLGKQAKKGLTRIGDIICPKNADFPSYSELGAVQFVDEMLETAPKQDIGDLNMLLTILSFMPDFVLQWLVKAINRSHKKNGGLSGLFRQLDFGFKGIVFGTYYSGKRPNGFSGKLPTEVIDFSITRLTL